MNRYKSIILAVSLVIAYVVYLKVSLTLDTYNRVGEKVEIIIDHVDPENINAVVEGAGSILNNAAEKIDDVDTKVITDNLLKKIDKKFFKEKDE